MIKKRGFFILCLAMGLIFSGIVYASGTQEDTDEGKEKLVIWQHKEAGINNEISKLIDRFKAKNPRVEIKFEIFEEVSGYNTKLVTAIASGGGPDIFDANGVTAAGYDLRGMLQPMDLEAAGYSSLSEFEEQYVEGALNPFKNKNGELNGVPFNLTPWQIFVNTKLTDQAGVSFSEEEILTWDEFIEKTSKVAEVTGKKGYQLPFGGPFGWYLLQFEANHWQQGATVFTEDQQSALDSEATRNVIELWKKMYESDMGMTSEFPGANPVFEFAQGDSATTLAGPWALGTIKSISEETADNLKIIPLPQFDPDNPVTVLNAWGFFINANSSNAGLASRFMAMLPENSMEWFTGGGGMMPTVEVYNNPAAQSVTGYDVFKAGLGYGRFREGTPYYDETGDAIKEAIDKIILLGEDMDEQLVKLDKQINQIQNQ